MLRTLTRHMNSIQRIPLCYTISLSFTTCSKIWKMLRNLLSRQLTIWNQCQRFSSMLISRNSMWSHIESTSMISSQDCISWLEAAIIKKKNSTWHKNSTKQQSLQTEATSLLTTAWLRSLSTVNNMTKLSSALKKYAVRAQKTKKKSFLKSISLSLTFSRSKH